jgi:hypothetical protein
MLAALDASDAIALGAGIVSLISLAFAGWSVGVARKANKISEGSNDLAKESNDIAREALQHSGRSLELAEAVEADRQRHVQARAVMRAEVTPLFQTTQATMMNSRPKVVIRNVGDRDSGPTVVRVYMRAGSDLMAWEDEHHSPDRVRPIRDPEVVFTDISTGATFPTQYLERKLDNITPSMPVEMRFVMPIAIPRPEEGTRREPVRVVVRAANADEPFEWTDYVNVSYGPPSA